MPITGLDHYLLIAKDMERTKDFYCSVLGFQIMPRPDFPFPGYWLGVNGKIQVHMAPAGIANSELYYLGSLKGAATTNSGVVDHVAFVASDPHAFVEHLRKLGVPARPRSLPDVKLYQLFIKDPDGLTIELNFFGVTDALDWGGEVYSEMPRAESKATGRKMTAAKKATAKKAAAKNAAVKKTAVKKTTRARAGFA
jgi:catechol 2,3-dioxygenase-like lactoylglutathione lyase family enzyme